MCALLSRNMGNSQRLCERQRPSAGCPRSRRTRLPPASRSILPLSPFPGGDRHSASPHSGWRSPGEPGPLSTQLFKGGRTKGRFTVVRGRLVLLHLNGDGGQGESPGQGGAVSPFRSWLLRPNVRRPQRCRERAESQGGSEEAGPGGGDFPQQALSQGHSFRSHKLCS